MTSLNRREFFQYIALTGAVGASTLVGYRWWQEQSQAQTLGQKSFPAQPAEAQVPLLLVTNSRSKNPFGAYLGEILRAEGLTAFRTAALPTITAEILAQYRLVLLAEGPIEAGQLEMLRGYVANGGRLLAMRPAATLAPLLGVEPLAGLTSEGYLRIAADHPLGQTIAPDTLQFHGQAGHYRPETAEVIAWLYQDATTPLELPAVTVNRYEQGQAAMWSFDLARSVAYTRQGNPAWADAERDGADGIRANDAFVGWIDLERIQLPQADEQMRLLSGLISTMLADTLPLPRMWYFPEASPAMLIVTGDAHANPTAHMEALLPHLEAYGGTMSIYYTPPERSDNPLRRRLGLAKQQVENWLTPFPEDTNHLPTPAEVAAWRARGHEFSLHPYVEGGLESGYQRYAADFEAEGYGLPGGTVRTHRILWDGWADTAKVQAAQGFGMNLDFYHIGPSFQTKDGRWTHGYFTGSGLPLKMVDESGQIIENYQLLTELVDEYLLLDVNSGWQGLDSQAAVAISKEMIDGALMHHTALTTQFHLDFYYPESPVRSEVEKWAEGTLAYAHQKGLPIWSAARYLDFIRCRDQAHLYNLAWNEAQRRLTFRLLAAESSDFNLTVRLPETAPVGSLSQVWVDGQPAAFTLHRDRAAGAIYALLAVVPGVHTIDVEYAG